MAMLSRDEILGLSDIEIKKVVVPAKMPKWGGKEFYIRQLTRGNQDEYLKRRFGGNQYKPGGDAQFDIAGLYGHDAWLCTCGVCDDKGQRLFTPADEEALNEKSGEFVGWMASQILEFSGMLSDVKAAKKLEALKQETKN